MDHIGITEKSGANYILLEISGVITSNTFTELQNKVFDLIRQTNLVIDLAECTKIDSSGLSVIMGVHNEGEDVDHKLYIMRPSSDARHAIDSTGFTDTFNIIHSVTEVN